MKKVLVYILLLSPLVGAAVPLPSEAAFNAATAKTYLAGKTQSPWMTMGLVAAGESSPSLDYLASVSGGQANSYATPILALTAAGKDPRTFGSEDYVAKLKSFYNNNQLGDSTALNDDIFGLMALISAGEPKTGQIETDVKNFILNHQAANGGWGFAVSAPGDSDMTAAAITSLIAAGVDKNDPKIQAGFQFLKTNQKDSGGFLSSPSFDTDANTSSTAWVVWALTAAGISPESWNVGSNNPITYLESAQGSGGWFADQPGGPESTFTPTSAYAVIALSGKTLPLKIMAAQATPTVAFRIEGKNETVCEGNITAITALDVVRNASSQCGYTYNIQATPYGPYLNQIGTDTAAGLVGWQYAVNLAPPDVGASDYQLKTNDKVLWYFGNWDDKMTRLTLDNTSVASGQSAIAKIEFMDTTGWQPLPEAVVYFGATTANTTSQGQASVGGADGYYRVFAQKAGYVRTNSVLLKIGSPTNSSVALNVNVTGILGNDNNPPPPPPDISFSVDPGSLDFGDLSAGMQSNKNLVLKNSGSKMLNVQAVVDGDGVFKDNLRLGTLPWNKYQTQLNAGAQNGVTAQLSIPNNYPDSGKKQGQIIFWAQAAQ